MKILYSPQRADSKIKYSFVGEVIIAKYTYQEETEVEVIEEIEVDGELTEVPKMVTKTLDVEQEEIFDFTDIPNGILEEVEVEALPFNPILKAERVEGELKVTLLNFIGANAKYEEKFPVEFDTLDLIESEVIKDGEIEVEE